MSCPKCETGLMVIETVTTGGFQFEQWRCVNCGKRMNEEEYMGWTQAQRLRHSETMKNKWADKKGSNRKAVPKDDQTFTVERGFQHGRPVVLEPEAYDAAEQARLKEIDHEACREAFGFTPEFVDECNKAAEAGRDAMLDRRSPAVFEIDNVIAELEEDIERINQEVTTLRSIRARLVQRQGS